MVGTLRFANPTQTLAGDDGGRQGRPQGVWRKAQAVMAGEVNERVSNASSLCSSTKIRHTPRKRVSSTLRLFGSIAGASEYWIIRFRE
jgi:hypothetical protein